MCTAMVFTGKKGEAFFGRTMDFSYPLHPQLFAVSAGHQWKGSLGQKMSSKIGFLAIGQEFENLRIFTDRTGRSLVMEKTIWDWTCMRTPWEC